MARGSPTGGGGSRRADRCAVAAVHGARIVCDISLTRCKCPTAHGSRCAVRFAREGGGGAPHVALGKNPKKSPHIGGLDRTGNSLRMNHAVDILYIRIANNLNVDRLLHVLSKIGVRIRTMIGVLD